MILTELKVRYAKLRERQRELEKPDPTYRDHETIATIILRRERLLKQAARLSDRGYGWALNEDRKMAGRKPFF